MGTLKQLLMELPFLQLLIIQDVLCLLWENMRSRDAEKIPGTTSVIHPG